MERLGDGERPLKEPFWAFETVSEGRIVEGVLKRRFPQAFEILTESLESADPFDIVYPGNPGEYSDVVGEILVLLAPVNAALDRLTVEQIDKVVREGLARRFGEPPDEERVREAVRLIAARASSG